MKVSEQLRLAIKESHLTINQIAKKSRVKWDIVKDFMDAKHGITTSTMDKICQTLEMSLSKSPKPTSETENSTTTISVQSH